MYKVKRRIDMKYIMRVFILLNFVLFLNSCTTMADSISSKGTEQFRIYEKAYDPVWNAVVEVVRASKLQLISEDKEKGRVSRKVCK